MNSVVSYLSHCLKLLAGFFPGELPRGKDEMTRFIANVLALYGLPDNSSYHQAIATMILHLGPTVHRKSKRYFACSVKKAMANQVAYGVIEEIKESAKLASSTQGKSLSDETQKQQQAPTA